MRPCFICGSERACKHREPELLAWEIRLRKTDEALNAREADRMARSGPKSPASAPSAWNGQFPKVDRSA